MRCQCTGQDEGRAAGRWRSVAPLVIGVLMIALVAAAAAVKRATTWTDRTGWAGLSASAD